MTAGADGGGAARGGAGWGAEHSLMSSPGAVEAWSAVAASEGPSEEPRFLGIPRAKS